MALLITNTMHPYINRRPHPTPAPGPPTSLARIEAASAQGSYNLVMLTGMDRSPALPGAGDLGVHEEWLANPNPIGFIGLEKHDFACYGKFKNYYQIINMV